MQRELAEEVSLLALETNARFNALLLKIQAECSEQEFSELRSAFGQVMGRVVLEISRPLYERHPELRPVELGGSYVVPKHIFTGKK